MRREGRPRMRLTEAGGERADGPSVVRRGRARRAGRPNGAPGATAVDVAPPPPGGREAPQRLDVAAEQLALAQQDVAERERPRSASHPWQVAQQLPRGVVLGDHQIAVAELHAPVLRRAASRGSWAVDARCVPRRGRGSYTQRQPEQRARQARSASDAHSADVLVEDLAADRALLERLAPVQHRRAVAAERLARGSRVPGGGLAVADQAVLAAPVDDHPRRVEHLGALLRLGPVARTSLGATEPTPGSLAARPARRRGIRVEHAVGVEQQDGVAAVRGDPGVHRGRCRRRARAAARRARRARSATVRCRRCDALSTTTTSASCGADAAGRRVRSRSRLVDGEDQDRRASPAAPR